MYTPCYRITPLLVSMLTQIASMRTTIAAANVELNWKMRLQRETMARLAHSSTAIEGNPLSLAQVESLVRDEPITGTSQSKTEVENYIEALRWVWKFKSGMPLAERDLCYLHGVLMKGLLPSDKAGVYKQVPNRVIDPKGYLVYLPPSPEKSPGLVSDMFAWLNDAEASLLDPVIVSAIAHHRLVSIHPFSDGNGRLSRLLGVWVLRVWAADFLPVCAVDDYFEQDRDQYYLKLQQARDLDDDLTYWIEYVAIGVRDTLQAVMARIALATVETPDAYVLTAKQEEVIRFLRDRGRVAVSELENAFGVTRSRVNQIVKPLVDQGIVHRIGQTRATRYFLK